MARAISELVAKITDAIGAEEIYTRDYTHNPPLILHVLVSDLPRPSLQTFIRLLSKLPNFFESVPIDQETRLLAKELTQAFLGIGRNGRVGFRNVPLRDDGIIERPLYRPSRDKTS